MFTYEANALCDCGACSAYINGITHATPEEAKASAIEEARFAGWAIDEHRAMCPDCIVGNRPIPSPMPNEQCAMNPAPRGTQSPAPVPNPTTAQLVTAMRAHGLDTLELKLSPTGATTFKLEHDQRGTYAHGSRFFETWPQVLTHLGLLPCLGPSSIEHQASSNQQ